MFLSIICCSFVTIGTWTFFLFFLAFSFLLLTLVFKWSTETEMYKLK